MTDALSGGVALVSNPSNRNDNIVTVWSKLPVGFSVDCCTFVCNNTLCHNQFPVALLSPNPFIAVVRTTCLQFVTKLLPGQAQTIPFGYIRLIRSVLTGNADILSCSIIRKTKFLRKKLTDILSRSKTPQQIKDWIKDVLMIGQYTWAATRLHPIVFSRYMYAQTLETLRCTTLSMTQKLQKLSLFILLRGIRVRAKDRYNQFILSVLDRRCMRFILINQGIKSQTGIADADARIKADMRIYHKQVDDVFTWFKQMVRPTATDSASIDMPLHGDIKFYADSWLTAPDIMHASRVLVLCKPSPMPFFYDLLLLKFICEECSVTEIRISR